MSAKPVFWISAALVGYTYVGYPVLMALAARLRPRRWKRAPVNARVSVVMAVHNGAVLLPAKIDHLLALDPEHVKEVIVVSDGSTDDTAAILQQQSDPRLKSLVLLQQAGKSAAVNRGVAFATGDIVLFVDIRPRIAEGALPEMLSNFADPSVGCVAGELVVRTDASHDAAASAVGGLYWKYEQWIRNSEAAFDSPVGVYGGFYAIRRELYAHAPEGLILDDMYQPQAIIRQGYRSVVDRNAIVIDTWPAKTSGEFARKVRTLAGNFQLFSLAPWVLSPRNRVWVQLVSHKVCRLIVPYALVAMLGSAWSLGMASPKWLAVAGAQTLFWGLAAAALRVRVPVAHRVAAPASALLVLNAAAVAALYRFLFTRGPLWKIWSPTSTVAANNLALWSGQEKA